MSQQVFNQLKTEIEKTHSSWIFNQRNDGNWSLSSGKVFAYFDYVRGGNIVIRARIYPSNSSLKEFSSWQESDKVGKIGSWKNEVIDIPLSNSSKISEYISLLEITAYGRKISNPTKVTSSVLSDTENKPSKKEVLTNTIKRLESIYKSGSEIINKFNSNEHNNLNISIRYDNKSPNNEQKNELTPKVVETPKDNKQLTPEEIKKFIYPFAYSYYFATEGTSAVFNKLNSYFKLFEVVSTFNAITLLSALPQIYIREYEQEIWTKDKNRYSRLSMGLWIDLYRRLSNIYKTINRKDSTFLSNLPFGPEFYFSMIDKKLLAILEQIPEKRNLFAHSGVSAQESILKRQLEELNPLLDELFNRLAFFKPISLIYPISMKKKMGVYETNIKLLNGAISDPFQEKFINVSQDLDSETLYLYMNETQERIKLLPEFIHLHDCLDCGQSSLYVFDKMERERAEYYSFHNVNHRYKTDINGLLNIFI